MYRARRYYFSGGPLDDLFRWYRQRAVKTAKTIGALDPEAGSWTHPAKSQAVVGDMTWIPASAKHHHSAPFDPKTGKTRKFDPHADFHHTRDGNPTKVPGRELVMLSCRTGHPNERIPLDAEFMPRKKCPTRKGRNEADHAVGMLKRLVAENPDELRGEPAKPGGLRCFIHDMAMDSEAIDDVLDMRLLPVAKVPKTAGGKCRYGTLGPHTFTTLTGSEETHDVKVFNGNCWVQLPFRRKTEIAVPLERTHAYWGTKGKKRSILYCSVALPHNPVVPKKLRGATTVVRFNSTDEEIHNTPNHTRRTRMLRPIPEADNDFKIYGAREDIESMFGDLKYKTRSKLPSINEDPNRLCILSYMILRLSRTESAYHKRIARHAHKARPQAAATHRPHKPGSRHGGPQRRSAATSPRAVPIAV